MREADATLAEQMVSYSVLSHQFLIVLGLAAAIASFGLMGDSAVAIVGAMLIAPLMKPIVAFSYGVVVADARLGGRAFLTLVIGMSLTVGVAWAMERLFGLDGPTREIVARTAPSLLDLGVAVAAGIAAAMAAIRRNVADALPGVAIAVALVPPLCAAGIAFSIGAAPAGWGASLLFAINFIAIFLSVVVVLLLDGRGSIRHAWLGLALAGGVGVVLSFPLTDALARLRADDRAQAVVEQYLREQYPINGSIHPDDLSALSVIPYPDHMFIYVELKGREDAMGEPQWEELRGRLQAALDVPVNLKVQLMLSREMTLYPNRNKDGKVPDYGVGDLIPRR